jgi:hypothetical protein
MLAELTTRRNPTLGDFVHYPAVEDILITWPALFDDSKGGVMSFSEDDLSTLWSAATSRTSSTNHYQSLAVAVTKHPRSRRAGLSL